MPLFFGATYRENLTGLGLITLGLGVAAVTVLAVAMKAEASEARHSRRALLASVLVFAVHGWLAWLVGLGLLAFGAGCLLIALGGG